jgi:hypothetical protein
MIKEDSAYQDKWYIQKRERKKSYLSRSTSVPRLGLGGLSHKKRREKSLSVNHIDNYRKRQYMFIFLSLYPKKFGYSLGGYSHRERCRARDRRKSTEERREVEANDREPAGGQVF